MKINLKVVVFAILGVFLVKISIADSFHDKNPKAAYVQQLSIHAN